MIINFRKALNTKAARKIKYLANDLRLERGWKRINASYLQVAYDSRAMNTIPLSRSYPRRISRFFA